MGQLQDCFSKVLRSFINFVAIILAAERGAGGRPGKEGNIGILHYWHLNSNEGIFDHGAFLPSLSLFLMQMY